MTAPAEALMDEDYAPRRPKPRGSRKPVPSEAQIQKSIISRLAFFGVAAFHVPNEGKRTRNQHVAQKRQGMVKGAPDLVVFRAGAVAFLECKRPGYSKKAKKDQAQRDFHALALRQNVPYAVVTGQDEAIRALESMGWVFR